MVYDYAGSCHDFSAIFVQHYFNILNESPYYVYYFCWFLSDFQAIFALITIFRNVHRPHQQYPNTINNSLDHVYSLVSDFSYWVPSLEKCTDHVKSTPTLSPILMMSTIPFFLLLLQDLDTNHHDFAFLNFLAIHFFLIFWLHCVSYLIWKCAQTM